MQMDEVIAHAKKGGKFTVGSGGGIAYWFKEVDTESDEDTEWTGIKNPTGKARMVMVGDDYVHTVYPEELVRIEEEDYCPECGQIGCKAYE
jgi:hypothetical protein